MVQSPGGVLLCTMPASGSTVPTGRGERWRTDRPATRRPPSRTQARRASTWSSGVWSARSRATSTSSPGSRFGDHHRRRRGPRGAAPGLGPWRARCAVGRQRLAVPGGDRRPRRPPPRGQQGEPEPDRTSRRDRHRPDRPVPRRRHAVAVHAGTASASVATSLDARPGGDRHIGGEGPGRRSTSLVGLPPYQASRTGSGAGEGVGGLGGSGRPARYRRCATGTSMTRPRLTSGRRRATGTIPAGMSFQAPSVSRRSASGLPIGGRAGALDVLTGRPSGVKAATLRRTARSTLPRRRRLWGWPSRPSEAPSPVVTRWAGARTVSSSQGGPGPRCSAQGAGNPRGRDVVGQRPGTRRATPSVGSSPGRVGAQLPSPAVLSVALATAGRSACGALRRATPAPTGRSTTVVDSPATTAGRGGRRAGADEALGGPSSGDLPTATPARTAKGGRPRAG